MPRFNLDDVQTLVAFRFAQAFQINAAFVTPQTPIRQPSMTWPAIMHWLTGLEKDFRPMPFPWRQMQQCVTVGDVARIVQEHTQRTKPLPAMSES